MRKSQTELPTDFETALVELEALVERLERGDLPLEEALLNFERGVSLTRQCQGALQSAQQKVEILLQRPEKGLPGEQHSIEPFDAG
ncbi:MAG: exodeoxyribonuclease VII small subunit [Steroidobacteraceae bacterium]